MPFDDGQLFVIHVVNENDKLLKDYSDGEALEYLFSITKVLGAQLVVKRSKNIINTMVAFANENEIDTIIMGSSQNQHNPYEEKLKKKLKGVKVIVL